MKKPIRLHTQVQYEIPGRGKIILIGTSSLTVDGIFAVPGISTRNTFNLASRGKIDPLSIRELAGTVYSDAPVPTVPDADEIRLPIFAEELELCRLIYEEVLTVIVNPLRVRTQNPFE